MTNTNNHDPVEKAENPSIYSRRRRYSVGASQSQDNNYQPLEKNMQYNEIDLDDIKDEKK